MVVQRFKHIDVALYFGGNMGNLYQIKQWLPAFYALDEQTPLLIITRNVAVYQWLLRNTSLQLVHCERMDDLFQFYENNSLRCILYVNNTTNNFQSLNNNTALHVHINHGESEKTCMFSNRAKAYDYVMVVGEAGYDRYVKNLLHFDRSKLLITGRPQLDSVIPIEKPNTERKVILYAPTWEGANLSMNYTSVADYGLTIVEQLLNSDDYYLLYRPHPNTGSREKAVQIANKQILQFIDNHPHAKVMTEGEIGEIFPMIDLAVFDNSSVAIDYLNADKPMLMTDYFHRMANRFSSQTISNAALLINDENYRDIKQLVERELQRDSYASARHEARRYFLGQYRQGESTQTFIQHVLNIVDECNAALARRTQRLENN